MSMLFEGTVLKIMLYKISISGHRNILMSGDQDM